MRVRITKQQAEISTVAFDLQQKEAMNAGSGLRRLNVSDKLPQEILGTTNYLIGIVTKAMVGYSGDDNVELDVHVSAAKVWVNALVIFHLKITKRHEADQQLTLETNVDKRKAEAQRLIDALSEQLSLGDIDLDALATNAERPGELEQQERDKKKEAKEAELAEGSEEVDEGDEVPPDDPKDSPTAAAAKKWDRKNARPKKSGAKKK